MAGTNQELARQGGRVNVEGGQLLTATDIDRIGEQALQTFLHFLLLLYYDEAQTEPRSGFPREQLTTDHCRVTATGDLTFEVSPGFGLLFDVAQLGADEWGPTAYLPVVVDAATAGALAAHDPTDPRIDLVVIAPARVDDQTAVRNTKDPVTGVESTFTVDQRRRFGATITVVAGTPAANPSPPAVPAGTMEIARCYVPAGSGATEFVDTRQVLEIGHLMKGAPGRLYTRDFVPEGGANELEVEQQATPAMYVRVQRGRAVINGLTRSYPRQDLQVTAADPSDPRIDVVYAAEDGTVGIVDGTPAASPSAPAKPGQAVALAEIYVNASATSIVDANITDRRIREPYNGNLVQPWSIDDDRLVTSRVYLDVNVGAPSGDEINLTLQLYLADKTTAVPEDLPVGAGEQVWEVLALKRDPVIVGAGLNDWGLVNAIPQRHLAESPQANKVDEEVGFTAEVNTSNEIMDAGADVVVGGRFIFSIDSTAVGNIKFRRKDGTVTGTWDLFFRCLQPLGFATTGISIEWT